MGQDVLSSEKSVSKKGLETKREYLGKEDELFYEAGPWGGGSGGRQWVRQRMGQERPVGARLWGRP